MASSATEPVALKLRVEPKAPGTAVSSVSFVIAGAPVASESLVRRSRRRAPPESTAHSASLFFAVVPPPLVSARKTAPAPGPLGSACEMNLLQAAAVAVPASSGALSPSRASSRRLAGAPP